MCAGELENWGGGGGPPDGLPDEVIRIRQRGGKTKKEKADKKGGASQKGENAMAEGLKLLFGGIHLFVIDSTYTLCKPHWERKSISLSQLSVRQSVS